MTGQDPLRGGHDLVPALILAALASGFVIMVVTWVGGTLGALAGGGGWNPPPFGVGTVFTIVFSGPGALWPQVAAGWIWAGIVLVTGAVVAPAVWAAAWVWRRWAIPPGLARPGDLRSLRFKELSARTRRLRPSLKDAESIPADATGLLLGDLDATGQELRASWEDVLLALMAPRAGKSTTLAAHAVLRAPGAVVLTSNKADVYAVTRTARAEKGTVWVFDPQGIAYTERSMWWDMLSQAATLEGARRLASHFISATVDAANRKDFWFSAASNTLTALFHAASRSGRPVAEVLEWLAQPADRTPVELLEEEGMIALAKQLEGTIHGAPDTRDGIFETARQCVACLLDPEIIAWVTRDTGKKQFIPREFVSSADTLYLLSKDGGGSAAGVIAAATDAVLRAGIAQAERMGGRIDPPLSPILDEAANICRLEDLPALFSHLGSRGIPIMTILQSYRQGVTVWGEPGMDALWSAATVKLLGAGLDDADFVEKISRLIGDHRVPEHSRSYGASGRSTSITYRRERTLQAADVRALPKGRALLLATGIRPALIRLRPWYAEPGADALTLEADAEVKAITARAIAADIDAA